MSENVISIKNLNKIFKIYNKPADLLKEMMGFSSQARDFQALKNISFDIKKGEVIGIVGRNGAGKSTLLKIITGTLDKTSGSVDVDGKVSAILELGTGFHPEYTGRENIYLGGMCLGMSRPEVNAKIDSIIDFSELGDFIEQPFKTYSSGMQARLTFATAISVEPELLIIDEALAAGDMFFAEKCYRRLRQITKSGTTVLFVTHSLPIIYELCDSAILMNKGEMIAQGDPRDIGHQYECIMLSERDERRAKAEAKKRGKNNTIVKMSSEKESLTKTAITPEILEKFKGEKVVIEKISVTDSNDNDVSTMAFGEEYNVYLDILFIESCQNINAAFRLDNPNGIRVTGHNTLFNDFLFSGVKGQRRKLHFAFECNLSNGAYKISGALAKPYSKLDPFGDYEQLHIYNPKTSLSVIRNPKNLGMYAIDCNISLSQ